MGASAVLGRTLTSRELGLFSNYLSLLRKWQRSYRLIGSGDPKWIVENILLDSLVFLRVLPSPMRSLLDLGSGAGVPGLPIKIVRDDVTLVLVESRRRRASFLSTVVRELEISNVRVIGGRIEDHTAELEGRFDAVVMRCAGAPEDLLPIAAKLVSRTGIVVAAGPPKQGPTSVGRWLTVPGWAPGTSRTFLTYRSA